MAKRFLFGVFLATLAGTAHPARAADLAPLYGQAEDEPVPPANFTFGTGWYLRGDLAASDDSRAHVLGALPQRSNSDRVWDYAVGGGVGYRFNEYLRGDVTGDYLGPQRTIDRQYFTTPDGFQGVRSFKTNLRRFDALANGYFDLGTWAGFTPYIGAGVGVAGVRLDGTYEQDVPGSAYTSFSNKTTGKTRYDLAWAAMAGVSYQVSSNLLIDVGYRYLDQGTYEVPRFLSRLPFATGTNTELTSHQIRAGLRYMIY